MTTPDYRALCAELLAAADEYAGMNPYMRLDNAMKAARAALAEPEPVGPSDEELLELWSGWNIGFDPQKGPVLMPHPAEYARAVLARWGHLAAEPEPPVNGEVAELVEALRHCSDGAGACGDEGAAWVTARAADLLERLASPACVVLKPSPELIEAFKAAGPGRVEPMERLALQPVLEGPSKAELRQLFLDHSGYIDDEPAVFWSDFYASARAVLARWGHLAPQPVPVSERSPGLADCDALGRCWCYGEGDDMFGWTRTEPSEFYYYSATHWLPFTALPLPTVGHAPNA